MRIDSDTDLDDNPEPAGPMNIVGIATQFDSSDPKDEGYQILPQMYTDISQNVPAPPSPNFYFTADTKSAFDGQTVTINSHDDSFLIDWDDAVDLNGDALNYDS